MKKEGYFWWIGRSLGFPSEKRKLLRKFRSINSQKYKLIEAPKMGTVAVEIVFCRITRRVKEKRIKQVKGLNFRTELLRNNQSAKSIGNNRSTKSILRSFYYEEHVSSV